MGYLRVLLDKIDYRNDDSLKKAFAKGLLEGALDGLVIVGAVQVVSNIVESIKK